MWRPQQAVRVCSFFFLVGGGRRAGGPKHPCTKLATRHVPHDLMRVPVEGPGPGAAHVQNLEGALGPDDGQRRVRGVGAHLFFLLCAGVWIVGGEMRGRQKEKCLARLF